MIPERNPSAIINSRPAGYGDYATPGQRLPTRKPAEKTPDPRMTVIALIPDGRLKTE